jgi:hypothetical protein
MKSNLFYKTTQTIPTFDESEPVLKFSFTEIWLISLFWIEQFIFAKRTRLFKPLANPKLFSFTETWLVSLFWIEQVSFAKRPRLFNPLANPKQFSFTEIYLTLK